MIEGIEEFLCSGFEGRHPVRDDNALAEDVVTYPDTADYAFQAAIRQLRGDEQLMADKQTFLSTHRLYCDVLTDVEEGDRVTYKSDNYEVVTVNDVADRGELLQVDLKWLS